MSADTQGKVLALGCCVAALAAVMTVVIVTVDSLFHVLRGVAP